MEKSTALTAGIMAHRQASRGHCSRPTATKNSVDSSATAIAGAVLSEAEITVEDVTREGEKRHILYIMDAGNGLKKEKKATVRKIEGVWKVEEITDRP